ncbi:MAG TPA: polyphenol oxidase family protein [Acidimicrobiales bacterium]|nr:polyphenol oxidase family protein [Acidimicrobiales bacterium]
MRPVIHFTDTTDGSFALLELPETLGRRRRAVTELPVTWLSQVHGTGVVDVLRPGDAAGESADAAVTAVRGAALSVITADCAPVLLASDHAVAAVHAGWRGLVAGVVGDAVRALAKHGDGPVRAWLGPCIRARCYEFGADDLDTVATSLGDGVRARTAWGTPALDVSVAVRTALGEAGVVDLVDTGVCTACSPAHFSHRARGDLGRQAAFVWLED